MLESGFPEWDYQLEQASAIQRRLIPTEVNVPSLEIVISFEPCPAVGGDYVDAVPMPDGRILLTIADGSGASGSTDVDAQTKVISSTEDLGGPLQLAICGRLMPSFFMRDRSVLGFRSRRSAALFLPLIFHWQSSSTRVTWALSMLTMSW